MARDRGIRVGYHNHDFEFAAIPGGGTGFEILLGETDPALVDFELDIYWAVKGGHNPLDLFARYPGRFPLWHVKDMSDRAGAQRMADVGAGEIDFRGIFAAREQAGLRHFFVERDDPTDSLASIRTSYTNLRRLLS
jgi:sugar phosphate isomerase/epimerase